MNQSTKVTQYLRASLVEDSELEFNLPALKVISYRGPGQSAGVSTSLEPIVKRLNTKVSWFALTGQPEASGGFTSFTFHTPSAAGVVLEQHARMCSDYIRPLFHGVLDQAQFDPVQWKSFKQLNALVASEALNVSSQSFPTLFWIHDHELPLVAPMISAQAGVVACHFWHIPWPSPSIVLSSPIGRELVEAMLANRLIGFQTSEYATNFLSTVQELDSKIAVDLLKMEIKSGRSTTKVVAMPFGIDCQFWQEKAKQSRPLAHLLMKRYGCGVQLALGIDRLDSTKGIVQKLDGLAEFLRVSPSWQKRFQYVQLTHADDIEDPSHNFYLQEVTNKVAIINNQHGSKDWQPIIHLQITLDKSELAAWYQTADVLAVNSFIEGLSLVAKEYVASRLDEQGVLLLSKGSGSTSELGQGAVLIDPLSRESFAAGLLEAFSMSSEEKRRRMQIMKRVVSWNSLQDWAVKFLRQALN